MEISVHPSMLISELKYEIERKFCLSAVHQKLIFQGKLLADSDTVSRYKIQPGFVIQLFEAELIPPLPDRRQEEEAVEDSLSCGGMTALGDIPRVENLEAVRQALVTIESLFEGMRDSPLAIDPTQGEEPEQVQFPADRMVAGVIRCYLNLMDADSFKEAIISDTRSYNHSLMVKAVRICYKRMAVNQEERSKFEQFVTSLRDMSHKQASIEELLGEIPDEFTCPISCELMKNPVRLPGSKTICDRATIERHLLNDPHDPFNRQPLLIEDVVYDVGTKQKINEWMKAKVEGR